MFVYFKSFGFVYFLPVLSSTDALKSGLCGFEPEVMISCVQIVLGC